VGVKEVVLGDRNNGENLEGCEGLKKVKTTSKPLVSVEGPFLSPQHHIETSNIIYIHIPIHKHQKICYFLDSYWAFRLSDRLLR